MKTAIPCPNCGTEIPIETDTLLKGSRFCCGHCGASVGLCAGSRPVVSKALNAFDTLKRQTRQYRTEH
ncbi:hypothetical protein [Gallaecimonas mangrovi]|uniref:hypothetical protein n=1 Tax=Gallaecimonas mangrovi TaxID=2291597 RepID=UPI000E2095DD|nr:hypothetical protein [Gallaecimonas mangrovi]